MAMSAQYAQAAPTSPMAQYMMHGGPYTEYLPGCSFAQQHGANQPVTISNSMLQAYNKMRGPNVDGGNDPLFEWIQLREDVKTADGAPRNKQDVTQMLAKVDEALLSGNATGDSPRDSFFELQRPPSDHLRAPQGHDLSTHAFAACCGDFVFEPEEEDGDDADAYMPSGRISPCTFLAWSKGCRRWDAPKVALEDDTKQRQRPPSPELTETPPAQPRPSRYPQFGHRQFDEEGGELSPHYVIPTSPSILYTAEGIDADRIDAPAFETRYARMNPFAAKALRKLKCGHYPGAPSASPTVSSEKYSYSEVEEVAKRSALPEALGFPSTAAVVSYLSGQYALIAQAEQENDALDGRLREQLMKIRQLEGEREELKLAVDLLREAQAQAHAAQQQRQQQHASPAYQRRRRRQNRMCHHMATHVREVAYRQQTSLATVERLRAQKEGNEMAIAGIESDILRLCFEVGKVCPLEIFESLSHTPLPVDELMRRIHRPSRDEQETTGWWMNPLAWPSETYQCAAPASLCQAPNAIGCTEAPTRSCLSHEPAVGSPHDSAVKAADACPGPGFEPRTQTQCRVDSAVRVLGQNKELRDSAATSTSPAKLAFPIHYGESGPPPLCSPDAPGLRDETTECDECELNRVILEAEAFIARLTK